MSKLLVLKTILRMIDRDSGVDSSDIIEKIKDELQQHDVYMYNKWKEDGFDINANSFDGSNLLCLAFGSNYVKVVELLIEKGANVNIRDNEGKAPLHFVNHPYMAEMLLNKGAEVNIQDNEGRTPLHLTPDRFSYIVEMLLNKGAEVNIKDNEGRTPLHFVKYKPIAELLLNNGAKIDIQDNEGRTPLHYAVSTKGWLTYIAEMLLYKGVEVDIQDNEGKTPLHLAASCSSSLCKYFVEMLLENDAEVNIQDNEGKTPLDYAISNGREEVIEILTGRILLSDEGLISQMSSEQEVEIDSQDQYESDFSYPLFF
ncbi:MAG: ankyrin repeat domain-containing protein [Wolbachia sp.]